MNDDYPLNRYKFTSWQPMKGMGKLVGFIPQDTLDYHHCALDKDTEHRIGSRGIVPVMYIVFVLLKCLLKDCLQK